MNAYAELRNLLSSMENLEENLQKFADVPHNEIRASIFAHFHCVVESLQRKGNLLDYNDSHGLSCAEWEALNKREKIQAIKFYRERTGADLRTAKEAVEYAMMKRWGYSTFN